jgi:hypothetical protein
LDAEILAWLSSISSTVVRVSIVLFAAVNIAAAGVFLSRKDRRLVQKWTGPWLATNALLIGAGLGTPLVVGITKLAVTAIATLGGSAVAAPTVE